MKEYPINEIDHKRILGRNSFCELKGSLALFWGGSALEINVRAREVYVTIETDYEVYEQWITVEINGVSVSRFMLNKEKTCYCIAHNLNPSKENLISIIKDVQPMNEDKKHSLVIHSVSLDDDGVFCPIVVRPVTMEFVGDSITAGEGLAGGAEEMDWISLWMRASQTYAVRLAKMMNADWNTMGKCGWGIVQSWDANKECAIPPHYEKVCSVLTDEASVALGAADVWDFDTDRGSDYVIINLGTNDETGMHANGAVPTDKDKGELIQAVVDFLTKVRLHNPTAKIIWCWGMLGLHVVPALIAGGVEKYKTQSGDENVFTLELEAADKIELSDEEKGSRGHPGLKTHQAAAEKIYQFIKSIQ